MIKRDKRTEKELALSRIEKLLELAEIVKFEDYKLAKRYVELSRRIASRYRIRLPKELRNFCRKCFYPYRHDKIRVRIKKDRVIITCLNCGYIRRVPLKSNLKKTNLNTPGVGFEPTRAKPIGLADRRLTTRQPRLPDSIPDFD